MDSCQDGVTVDEHLVEQLIDELSQFGISLTQEQAQMLVSYLGLVIEKNKVVNLTRITNPSEAITLHLVDSLLPLVSNSLHVDESSKILDMGTGAGFPGVPVAVVTGAQALLVDSVRKKTDAVAEFVAALGLGNVSTRHSRLEELARELTSSQDVVFARAVARTNVLIEYATPYLSQNGVLVVGKGRPEDDEITEAEKAAALCGLSLVSHETFELPHDLGHREILIYKKVGKSKIKLPRRTGLAKSQPLGV